MPTSTAKNLNQQEAGSRFANDSRNESITIFNNELGQAVSARELHVFLGNKKRFADWMRSRIEKYGLVENQDYTSFHQKVKRETGGSTMVEYALTLETAKELAMVEANEKGQQARRYFIECERKLKAVSQPAQLSDAELMARALEASSRVLAQKDHQIEQITKVVQEQAPIVQYAEQVLQSKSKITITTIAKELGMSAKQLNQELKELKIQFKQNNTWVLYQRYANKGYTSTTTLNIAQPTGETKTVINTVWTEKGRQFIHELINKRLNKFEGDPSELAEAFDIDIPFQSDDFKHTWLSWCHFLKKTGNQYTLGQQNQVLMKIKGMGEKSAIIFMQKQMINAGEPIGAKPLDFNKGLIQAPDGKWSNLVGAL